MTTTMTTPPSPPAHSGRTKAHRHPDRFRLRELQALGSRIRSRLVLQPYSRDDMSAFLRHFLDRATVPHLTTEVLHGALVDHSAGNPRILTSMAAELLDMAARRNLPQLDEKLSFEVHSRSPQPPRTRRQA